MCSLGNCAELMVLYWKVNVEQEPVLSITPESYHEQIKEQRDETNASLDLRGEFIFHPCYIPSSISMASMSSNPHPSTQTPSTTNDSKQ
jgi:hypothetical protein